MSRNYVIVAQLVEGDIDRVKALLDKLEGAIEVIYASCTIQEIFVVIHYLERGLMELGPLRNT